MTKLKIIGNHPGEHKLKLLKIWLRDSLRKFNLSYPVIYLAFIKNIQQLKRVFRRYIKEFEKLSSEEKSSLIEITFETFQGSAAAYIGKEALKESTPLILIKTPGEISEFQILDEIAHMREDEDGWHEIKVTAMELLFEDFGAVFGISAALLSLSIELKLHLFDFFSSEMMSKYKLNNEAFESNNIRLNYWIKNLFPQRGESKFKDFQLISKAVFWTTLPPSYPTRKEDEEKLEKIIINYLHEMSKESEYHKMKSIVLQLTSPPEVNNIYQCGVQIIQLAQDFLKNK
ncbi:MAG: hypothetical protein ACE5J0_01235 [Candidatus Paceibacterales bacterium]